MTEEQLQEIKARNQQLLDDGILLFRQDIEMSMKLVAEIEKLRGALELYADEKLWSEPHTYTDLVDGEPEEVKDAPWAILDGGEYARKALAGESK
ncbi:MAG: hypothetical protein ABS882_09675 [Lysinibacillus sp.]